MNDFRSATNPANDRVTATKPWLGLLLLVAAVSSFAPCLMPFSALAVALAASVRARTAFVAMGWMWLINQVVGYGLLDFPRTLESFSWGGVTLLAALAATAAAVVVVRGSWVGNKTLRVLAAMLAAYALYELVLLCAVPFLGGLAAFSPSIVGRIGLENIAWLAVLVLLNELLSLVVRPWLGRAPGVVRVS